MSEATPIREAITVRFLGGDMDGHEIVFQKPFGTSLTFYLRDRRETYVKQSARRNTDDGQVRMMMALKGLPEASAKALADCAWKEVTA